MSTYSERDPFKKLDLDDRRRPIRVKGTVAAGVPGGSERFLDHQVDSVQFPNGNEGYHHRITLPHGVMLAHLDDRDGLALVQNYRHPIGRDSVELPSGGLDPEEAVRYREASTEADREAILRGAALREFEEEVGWNVPDDSMTRLLPGPLQGSVGFADQTYNIYVGDGGTPTAQALDDGEQGMLKTFRWSVAEAYEAVGDRIVDPATSVAIGRLALELGVVPARRVLKRIPKARQ